MAKKKKVWVYLMYTNWANDDNVDFRVEDVYSSLAGAKAWLKEEKKSRIKECGEFFSSDYKIEKVQLFD